MRILIVGGVAGGASTAARLRRLNKDDEIVMFEKGPHVSFSNCCLPYHLSGTIATADALVLMCPSKFASQYRIDARVNHEVVSIDRTEKCVSVKNVLTGEIWKEPYDKLVLSPGASPIVPPIPGIEKQNIFTLRNVVDIKAMAEAASARKGTRITVVGGGFIGLECAENLVEAGHTVSLVEALPQIMQPLDFDMVQILHKEMIDNNVDLILGDKVVGFDTGSVLLESGKSISSDMVIMAIGVRPDLALAKSAGLTIGKSGGIEVDANFRTNDPDIYAVGDAIEVFHAVSRTRSRLALAGPAAKQARAVADHINGQPVSSTGFIGSSVIKLFGCNAASTGMNEAQLSSSTIAFDAAHIVAKDQVGIMPTANNIHLKVLFEVPTGRILGAQAVGSGNVDKRIDVIATAMKFNATVDHLKDLELCYAPPFGTSKDAVNHAGYVASNILHRTYRQVRVSQVRGLVEAGAFIVDVREEEEYVSGTIKGAVQIPLSSLREQLDEIPRDVPIYLHCRSGGRSYAAVLLLQQSGYRAVNIAGGFLALSYYEYYNDKASDRASILTDYNFF